MFRQSLRGDSFACACSSSEVGQDAVASDVLATPLASGVVVLIAVDLDIQLHPLFHQRKVQLVSLHIELGIGPEAPELHRIEQELLGSTVRAKARDDLFSSFVPSDLVAQIDAQRCEGWTAEFFHGRMTENDQCSTGAADPDIQEVSLPFDPAGTVPGHIRRQHRGKQDRITLVSLKAMRGSAHEAGVVQNGTTETILGELPDELRLRGERRDHPDRRFGIQDLAQPFDRLRRFHPIQPTAAGGRTFRRTCDVLPQDRAITPGCIRDLRQHGELIAVERPVEPSGNMRVAGNKAYRKVG